MASKLIPKRAAKFCDNCKFYSYNDDSIENKNNLLAFCNKNEKQTVPWESCEYFTFTNQSLK